jgi:mRNA interferase HigB
MRVVSKSALVNFWKIHPEAESRLEAWHAVLKQCCATNHSELKQTFGSADYVPSRFTVFDVGNGYRVVAAIHYNTQTAYIREVLTHAEYDKWTDFAPV